MSYRHSNAMQLHDTFYDATTTFRAKEHMRKLDPTQMHTGDIVLLEAHLTRFTLPDATPPHTTPSTIKLNMVALSQIARAQRLPVIQEPDGFTWSL